MSFILDALKKAEAERNRNIAPVLVDARVAPPRRGLPAWAWALGAVLLANLVGLAWLLLRAPATPPAAQAAPAPAGMPEAAAATPAPPAPAQASAPPPAPVLPTATPRPALPAATQPATPARASSDAGQVFPTLQELRMSGVSLPELQLNLHIYDPVPTHRAVMLDGIRLREGEYTPHGVKVERITPAGVVLEAAGRRFRLDAGG